MGLLELADRSWPLLTRVTGGHAAIYRATRGAVGHRFPGAPPTLLLEHEGAKSGKLRTTPVFYVRDGDDLVIVASKGGYASHPAWLHNLRAHPETTVQVGAERRPVRAREATPSERKRLWPMALDVYASYADYQARAGREIPLVVLERR